MKWLPSLWIREKFGVFPALWASWKLTARFTGFCWNNTFFGLVQFKKARSEEISQRLPYDGYQVDFGPGYQVDFGPGYQEGIR